jgi:hypothetical protein
MATDFSATWQIKDEVWPNRHLFRNKLPACFELEAAASDLDFPPERLKARQPERLAKFLICKKSIKNIHLLCLGVDVMITIFYDFSAKNAFFLNTNVTIKLFLSLALF